MTYWQFLIALVGEYFKQLFANPEQKKDEFHEVKKRDDCGDDPFKPSDF
jgi:hypothetical protein